MKRSSVDAYFIKPGYRPNLVQASFDESDEASYWNPQRTETAIVFQYDVYEIATKFIKTLVHPAIMDVGCGPPHKLARFLDQSDAFVQLVDQPNAGNFAQRLMPWARFNAVDLESIDMRLDRAFDVIICADVIEHLVDPDPCIAFIRRHLSPSGRLFISTPERDVLRGVDCIDSPHPMHVREWNQREFGNFLRSRGFDVVRQVLLPQKREPLVRKHFGRALSWLGIPPKWYSCQLAICQLQAERASLRGDPP